MKQTLLPDHIPQNNYHLIVLGGPPLIQFTKVDGIDEELETVDLPDRTKASGGNTKAFDFKAEHPEHHVLEDLFLEFWFREGQDPVSPFYKKPCVLLAQSISRIQTKAYNLLGVFISKRKLPDREMKNEGEMTVKEWTFCGDRILAT